MKSANRSAVILLLLCVGCAQTGGKNVQEASSAYRLQNLEASFGRFQDQERQAEEERRARDADIDSKLRGISQRLDTLGVGQPSAQAKGAKPAPAESQVQPRLSRNAPSAGQVIPYAQLSGAAPAVAPVPPMGPAGPGTQAPVSSAPAAPPAQAPAPAALPALRPPVVSLDSSIQPAQPSPVGQMQPAQPVPAPAAPAGTRKPVPLEPGAASPKAKPAIRAQAGPSPAETPAPAQDQAGNLDEEKLYTEAMRAVTSGKNDDGRRKFNELLAKYPSSAKAPLALFWIGESFMNDKSYNQAILSFKEVTTRFPQNFKVPEALYRIAEAYEYLGDKQNAAFHLKLLVDEHANSDLVGKAKQKLKQLGQ